MKGRLSYLHSAIKVPTVCGRSRWGTKQSKLLPLNQQSPPITAPLNGKLISSIIRLCSMLLRFSCGVLLIWFGQQSVDWQSKPNNIRLNIKKEAEGCLRNIKNTWFQIDNLLDNKSNDWILVSALNYLHNLIQTHVLWPQSLQFHSGWEPSCTTINQIPSVFFTCLRLLPFQIFHSLLPWGHPFPPFSINLPSPPTHFLNPLSPASAPRRVLPHNSSWTLNLDPVIMNSETCSCL